MNKLNQDIELIRKYHNGDLSPTEMNQLEARALDDPFLQDALDGYEIIGVSNSDINELNNSLAHRLEKEKKLFSAYWGFKQWSIAASIVFGIAIISIYFNQTPENKTIALNELQEKENIPKAEKLKVEAADKKLAENNVTLEDEKAINLDGSVAFAAPEQPLQKNEVYIAENEIVVEPMAKAAMKDTSKNLNEVVVVGYGSQYKKDLVGAVAGVKTEEFFAGRALRAAKTVSTQLIKGKIIDETDGTALPGVTVKDTKTGLTKQTDLKGEFVIDAGNKTDLSISYIGYETQSKTINKNDSLIIALKPSEASLSEVVVVGYGTTVPTDVNSTAGPKKGWRLFKEYLDNNASPINGQKGRVQVSFTILPNGNLQDFKTLKSLSKIADEKAISLIKDYKGGWNGSADGVAQTVRVTVRFK
ncbi:TonB family protein [Pedobacter alpinus]|uniref:TonB family protein n=1 Tax=Pedobacter alpinus TaxID=1590643 RepID=A0ABW5TQY7_9SPHI